MPSPAGKGDREAVDEENFLSCLPYTVKVASEQRK